MARWNGAELARALGVAATTVGRYLDVLVSALVLQRLSLWHENLGKRQIRAPKVYIADSGILHALLGIVTEDDLAAHPKVGASWEGFCMNEVISRLGARPEECYFWGTHAGSELDLLVVRGRRRLGFELKRTAAPSLTKSMRIALEDLRLDELSVIHAGEHTFPMGERVRAMALSRLLQDVAALSS